MKSENSERDEKAVPGGEIIVYQSEDGRIKLDIRLERETLWMTQSDMAALFQCTPDNVSLHLKNIYEEGELELQSTTEEFSVVQKEGERNVRMKKSFHLYRGFGE